MRVRERKRDVETRLIRLDRRRREELNIARVQAFFTGHY